MNVTGRIALVTGAAQGLGQAAAARLLDAGAAGVVVADVDEQQLTSAARKLTEEDAGDVLAVRTDVSDAAQVDAMVQAALERFGRIDVLVNNASVCPIVSWDNVDLESWNRVLAVNLTGMFLCTRAVIPHMKAAGGGSIVYVSSPAAYVGSIVAHVAYGVSKAGIIALMKSVAKGSAADGIRANAIAPGPMDTPMSRSLGPEHWHQTEQKTLLKRHAEATEVADAILFLVSDRSSYVTGHVLWVDGGYSLT